MLPHVMSYEGRQPMECTKCQGFMVHERIADDQGCITEWRCLNCGFMVDPVMERNRCSQAHRRRRPDSVFQESTDASDAFDALPKTISLLEVVGENCQSDADGRAVNHLVEDLLNEGYSVKL